MPGAYPSGDGCRDEGRTGKGGKESAAGHGWQYIIPAWFALASPFLGGMPDMQDFNGVLLDPVGDDVRQPLVEKLAGAFLPSLPSTVGEFLERTDGLADFNNRGACQMRFVFPEMLVNALQIRCGGGRPADTHQG